MLELEEKLSIISQTHGPNISKSCMALQFAKSCRNLQHICGMRWRSFLFFVFQLFVFLLSYLLLQNTKSKCYFFNMYVLISLRVIHFRKFDTG